MTQFSWDDDLHTGSAMIDGDHRELVRLINILFQAMEGGAPAEPTRRAMHELVAYTAEHFEREEAEMKRIQYVAELAHQTEHRRLIKQVIELEEILNAGGRINVPAVSAFLSEWLREHILDADMKLAAALKRELDHAAAPQAH